MDVQWVALTAILLLVAAVIFDLRSREIPDTISALIALLAISSFAFGWSSLTLAGILSGAAVAAALTLPLFMLEGIGGGDVKLVITLGLLLGPLGLLTSMFWMAIGGGLLACIAR